MQTYTLLPQTAYGIAAGDYNGSDLSFYSTPVKAAAYYSINNSIQTLTWAANQADCNITVQATLDTHADSDNYFTIHTIAGIIDGSHFVNIVGCYTWIRVLVEDFTAGSISSFTINY